MDEELIENPDKVQDELVKKFDLKVLHRFSDYPDFIVPNSERNIQGIYNLRKIGE